MKDYKLLLIVLLIPVFLFCCADGSESTDQDINQGKKAKIRQRLQEMDQNNDGYISREEFPGKDERFNRADLDADGYISREELKTVIKKLRKDDPWMQD